MKSPNLQPKKIFALWKGFPPIWGQNPFKKGENFNCSVICSSTKMANLHKTHQSRTKLTTDRESNGGEGLSGFNVFLKYGNAETQHVR